MNEEQALDLSVMLQHSGLPGVLLSNRPWRELTAETIAHLQRTNAAIYVRHGQLVRVQHKEDGTPFIEPLTETTLKGLIGRAMNFVKVTTRGAAHWPPPNAMVKDLLTLGQWPFPPLESIVEFPVLRPDGTLLNAPGYDPLTKLYYAPVPNLSIPAIPERPTAQHVVDALALIDEVIGEFPFENEASRANTIGLLLTPLIRQSIDGHVPLALIDATRPGTGKSLLAETVAFIATGRTSAMMAAPYDDDEWRKRIASTLSEGATIITIDNIKARLQAASLDLALTSHTVKERVLGESRNGIYAQRATWMATGNNIQLGGDLPRRCYWIRLDARLAAPWLRGGFKHDLETWVPAHRGDIIAALLTLARAWYLAGKPPAPIPRRMGSFQAWVDTVGGILAHTQLVEGFLENADQLVEQDDDAQQWAAFLHAWYEHYHRDQILSSQLAKDIKAGSQADESTALEGVAGLYNALPDDIADIQRGDFRRRLGKALAARVGARFDERGLHLVKGERDRRNGSVYWSVVEEEEPGEESV